MKRVHLFVAGRVQGVFFRQSAHDKALELGLSGWVRNRADGRVEGVAEGDDEKVDAWVAWCRQGPPSALVRDVSLETEAPRGEQGFHVTSTL